jgi:hypothetical protein
MIKRLLVFLLLLLIPLPVRAQRDTFIATVQVNSAFAHVAPSADSDRTASVFEDQELEVMGRNIDGTWFEVRRAGRLTSLGWLSIDYLDFDFLPENLPLTNLTVGIDGPETLAADPGFALYMVSGAVLRVSPDRTAARVGPGAVPRFVTVPVLERNRDGTWVRVYYRGYTGWLSTFTGRDMPNVMAVPEAPNIPLPETANIVIIPPEIQMEQLNRMREFITPRRALAENLEVFWLMVLRGEIMPCDPPESVTMYEFGPEDVRELPELQRYDPQLGDAVTALNESLAVLQNCGVIGVREVRVAHAAAINARIMFAAVSDRLDTLETIIQE